MPSSYEQARQIACELPADERILLADLLWASVDSGDEKTAGVEAAWDGEIKRRLDEIDSGVVQLASLEDVISRMDARILAKRRG